MDANALATRFIKRKIYTRNNTESEVAIEIKNEKKRLTFRAQWASSTISC